MASNAIPKELRRDPAPQLAAQVALEAARSAWLARPEVAAIFSELAAFGAGAQLANCGLLAALSANADVARAFARGFVASQARALASHPLGHVPFRHQYSGGIAVMQIAVAGRAALSLLTYEDRSAAPPGTVCFAGGERHEVCLAGEAEGLFVRRDASPQGGAMITTSTRAIRAGECLSLTDPDCTKLVLRPRRSLTILRLSRTDAQPAPAREYRLSDGALVHVASGNRGESAAEMAMAVLGAMSRGDAASDIAAVATSSSSEHLRWQALRQLLALDTGEGFATLTQIAQDAVDPLAAPAGALRASLIASHPALAGLNR